MKRWRHSLRGAAVSLAVAYALFAQAFLASIVVTEATAAGNANIICLGGNPGTPGHGDKLPLRDNSCVLCSLSACSAGAGLALDAAAAVFLLPTRMEARVAHASFVQQALPQPHRTPKLSQAPPQAV
ncbi:MAG: hypothetical protein KIT76_16320 [Pseudolabrys sp.]|nr:hypothetical protein [Pseudolabrys sp.]